MGLRHVLRSLGVSDEHGQAQVATGSCHILTSESDAPCAPQLQPSRTRIPSTPHFGICGPSGTPSGEEGSCAHAGEEGKGPGAGVWKKSLPVMGDYPTCGYHWCLGGYQDYEQ